MNTVVLPGPLLPSFAEFLFIQTLLNGAALSHVCVVCVTPAACRDQYMERRTVMGNFSTWEEGSDTFSDLILDEEFDAAAIEFEMLDLPVMQGKPVTDFLKTA
jgi:hypothetical protein